MIDFFKHALLWRPQSPIEDSGAVVPPVDHLVEDGVDYRRPLMIPRWLAGDAKQVNTYLAETQQSAAPIDNTRSTWRFQFDQGRSTTYDGPFAMPTDDPLCEWDARTRLMVLTNCHAAVQRNPIAKRIVDVTRQFAVGRGHQVTYQNQAVKDVIEAFRANPENNIFGYDRTFIQDLQVDGELFIRFYEGTGDSAGQIVIAPLRPWDVLDIKTDPDFFRRRLTYTYQARPGEAPIDIPADEVLHVAINAHSYELRGKPDLYVVLPWLRAYNEWLVDRARQNKWRGALLWWVKVVGGGLGAVAKARATWRQPPTPGSVAVTGEGQEVQAVTNPVGANDASEDGRQIRMMSAIGAGLPEYMLGDGENANLATATAQQLPSLWKFADIQELMIEQVWGEIYRRVVLAAVADGQVPEEVRVEDADGDPVKDTNDDEQVVAAEKAFAVQYYDLQSEDPKTLAEALMIATQNNWLSNETASGRMGFDYNEERKLIQREKQEKRDEVGQGSDYAFPPGQGPNEGGPTPSPSTQNQQQGAGNGASTS